MKNIPATLLLISAGLAGCASGPSTDTSHPSAPETGPIQGAEVFGRIAPHPDGGHHFVEFSTTPKPHETSEAWVSLNTLEPAWNTAKTYSCQGGLAGDCDANYGDIQENLFYSKSYRPFTHFFTTVFTFGIGAASVPFGVSFDEDAYGDAVASAAKRLGDYEDNLVQLGEERADYEKEAKRMLSAYFLGPMPFVEFAVDDRSGFSEHLPFNVYIPKVRSEVAHVDKPSDWDHWPDMAVSENTIRDLAELNSRYDIAFNQSLERLNRKLSRYDVNCQVPATSVQFPLNVKVDCPTSIPVDGPAKREVTLTVLSANLHYYVQEPALLITDFSNNIALNLADNRLMVFNQGNQFVDVKAVSVGIDDKTLSLTPNATLSPNTRKLIANDLRETLGKAGLYSRMTVEKAKATTVDYSIGMSYVAENGPAQKYEKGSSTVFAMFKRGMNSN